VDVSRSLVTVSSSAAAIADRGTMLVEKMEPLCMYGHCVACLHATRSALHLWCLEDTAAQHGPAAHLNYILYLDVNDQGYLCLW
jgi:hypothetical protein